MSATNSSSDKYAFLFNTGSAYSLSTVKTVLKTYYGYQDTISSVNHIVECTGCSNFKAAFKAFVTTVRDAGPATGSLPASAQKLTVIIYIFGESDASGLTSGTGNGISWSELRQMIHGEFPVAVGPPDVVNYRPESEVNLIIDAPGTAAFVSLLSTNVAIDEGTLLTAGTLTDLTGKWCNLMMLNTSGLVNSEGMLGMSTVAGQIFTNPADLANNFKLFGTSSEYFAGMPELYINDGGTPLDSPDVKLEHAAPYNTAAFENCFLTDSGTGFRNTVKVKVTNTGTHPVEYFRIDAALYTAISGPPGVPGSKSFGLDELSGILTPGNSGSGKVDNLSFGNPDFVKIAVKASFSGDADFTDFAVSTNNDEAQRNISVIVEPLLCSLVAHSATTYGGTDGDIEITITDTTGTAPYSFYLNGVIQFTGAALFHRFPNLASGNYTVKVVDSSGHPRSFESNAYVGQPSAPVTCTPRLDNNYVFICKANSGEIRFVLKVFPVRPPSMLYRFYKIRWKLTGLHPQFPGHPPVGVQIGNMTVTGSGTELGSGVQWGYVLLRIPVMTDGRFSISRLPRPWPFGPNPVIIPTEIYIRTYSLFPFRPQFRLVAAFRLKQDQHDLDVLVP